jgi:predicted 3-demethylubiquinone-9 3-methyltransferase (glyoxalase superfamily)
MKRITPCLWFDTEGEKAARFYVSVFPNSGITKVSRYGKAGQDKHGRKPGTVMAVTFELNGNPFMALNGGPQFKHSEAVSFMILCKDQKEIDHYWDGLLAGGGTPSMCGWLKDRYGVSWQVTPAIWPKLMAGDDPVKSGRAMEAMMTMRKMDIAKLKAAYDGKSSTNSKEKNRDLR